MLQSTTTSREVNEARRPHTCSRPCAFEEKKTTKKRNPDPTKTHHEIHSSPATGTTSRRFVTKNIPCLSPRSPASVDPGFVEIDLVQLSQTVKTTSVTHAHRQTDKQTDRQTDRQIRSIWKPSTPIYGRINHWCPAQRHIHCAFLASTAVKYILHGNQRQLLMH